MVGVVKTRVLSYKEVVFTQVRLSALPSRAQYDMIVFNEYRPFDILIPFNIHQAIKHDFIIRSISSSLLYSTAFFYPRPSCLEQLLLPFSRR